MSSGIIAAQEEKVLSIMFQMGEIPKEIKTNFQNIFTEKKSQTIVKAISQIHSGGKFNSDNVAAFISSKTKNEKWITEINRIKELTVPLTELNEILNSLKENLVISQINDIKDEIQSEVVDNGNVDAIEGIKKKLSNIIVIENSQKNKDMATVLDETISKIEEGKLLDSDITGISTGIKAIDDATGGLNKTDLIIVAARPGQGKTSLVINFINAIVESKKNIPGLFFSAEMPAYQLGMRLLAMQAEVDAMKMRTPKRITDIEMERILRKKEAMMNLPIITNDTAAISIQEITDIARRQKDENDIQVMYVDYIQRLKYKGFGADKMQKAERIAEITAGLKELAKELEIPVVGLAQLNRDVDGRPPLLSDLSDSSALEKEADIVGFIHRDFSKIEDINAPHNINYIIAKNRHGPLGFLELKWIPQYTKIMDMPEEGNIDEGPINGFF